MTRRVVIFLLFFSFISCEDRGSTAPPGGVAFDPIELRIGSWASFDAGELRFQFESVPDDSRCPENAECFWAGNAVVVLKFEDTRANLNTSMDPGQIVYSHYTIRLLSLTPYPKYPDEIPKDAYVVRLVVIRN